MRAIKVYAVASDVSVKELQEQFGIPGHVEFGTGQGDLPQVVLKHACGSKAAVWGGSGMGNGCAEGCAYCSTIPGVLEASICISTCSKSLSHTSHAITTHNALPKHTQSFTPWCSIPPALLYHTQVYLYGACISSWQQANGSEVLYMRPDAVFDKSKPISGGVPLCFPQFGPGAIQQHGFARNSDWMVASTSADPQPDDRDPEVEFVLADNEYTRAMWYVWSCIEVGRNFGGLRGWEGDVGGVVPPALDARSAALAHTAQHGVDVHLLKQHVTT